MKTKKRILVAPLNWGIGHSTRCIPIINALINNNYEVILAVDGRPLHLLNTEFPKLEIIRFPDYNINYSNYLPMSVSIFLQIPKLLWNIRNEQISLQSIIKDYNIDGVISDNRFGLFTNMVPCAFITHQLEIQSPYLKNSIRYFNYKYINRYNACWVIDNEENNLAGILSKPKVLPNNTTYIGVQSRFEKKQAKIKYDFLAIVSGPEPQRTNLEKKLIAALKNREEKSLIVLGKPELNTSNQIGNLTIKSHLKSNELNTAILQSKLIVCRPGYSTIMDLAKLEKKAIFIPTPGQTEQEYLATNFINKGICYSQKQINFNFDLAIKENENYVGFKTRNTSNYNWETLFQLFN